MAERKIIWTKIASLQLRTILEFWIENNKSNTYSLKLLNQVEENLKGIVQNPLRSPESIFPNSRVSAMKHYSIFYKVNDTEIVVIAFWDNRQDPKKLLKILTS
ncbi:MAG: plasmid stabilization protein [Cytophagaceae bacterium]|nr:plasmid stabilization protein [Cytophagaceae bacterium]|tara:strand:- start:13730 stop:14038 length:309 start_codon:yes stop_codon:yes gene_type:complete